MNLILRLKSICIDGYRCLCNLNLKFEDDITVIIGENDCGKSSIIDCIELIMSPTKNVEGDDFNYEKNEIVIKIETDDMVFEKKYTKEINGEINSHPLIAIPTESYKQSIIKILNSSDLDLEDEKTGEKIKSLARQFGQAVRSTSNISNLREKLLSQLNECDRIENAQFPGLNSIKLGGRDFENVTSFFKEVFLKERQTGIWNEKVNDNDTIVDFVNNKLNDYSEEISQQISERGIKDKIKLYIKNLTDIVIKAEFEPKDLNFSAKVRFLENDKEINIEKKGDGTKRRITMALLEYKKEEKSDNTENKVELYILDEPDTHLHVRAQLELFKILKDFSDNGKQLIIATHSPFIINAVKPKQIRLLYQPILNDTKVRTLSDDREVSDAILRDLGIENTFLYFSKYILLVEGETEEHFIPRMYQKLYDISIYSDLVKIINVQGIRNVYGFAKAISELTKKENLFVLMDNDAQPETLDLIKKLGLSEDNKYIIGDKEFEDSFSDDVIFSAWETYIKDSGRKLPKNCKWTIENIKELRKKCKGKNDEKFSTGLKELSAGTKKFTKPIFGKVLADYCKKEDLPEQLEHLLMKLNCKD